MIQATAMCAAVLVGLSTGVAVAQTTAFDRADCRYLPAHRPAPDVEYTPGVDVRGRPVAPADLPGSAGTRPPLDTFEMAVSIDIARRMGFRVPRGVPGDVEVGWLTLQGSNLYFNGQPLGGAREAELYAFCQGR